jgi:tyrosyl-tRNA synthetase
MRAHRARVSQEHGDGAPESNVALPDDTVCLEPAADSSFMPIGNSPRAAWERIYWRDMATAAHADVLGTLRQRGFVEQISDENALARQLSAGPLVFYSGFDPTAPSLHVGNYIPLLAMAHLARAGHQPIAVLGGGTALVGDPSGKTEMRQLISSETIAANRRGIELQVRRILGEAAMVIDNGDWLLPLNYLSFLRDIGRHFSVNRMLAAEAYKLRLEKGLSFIEFNYQLLQSYDFLVLKERFNCLLQMGGDDQWGNILAGIDLVRRVRQEEVFGLTFPLLTTSSGAKMGKTAAGAIWMDPTLTRPYDFFQYFVNVDDRDVVRFLKLLTLEPLDSIRQFETAQGADLRAAKRMLAHAVTTIVHGRDVADEVDAAARAAFGSGAGPAGDGALGASDPLAALPSVNVSQDRLAAGLKIVDLIAECGLAPSKSAARRLVSQGGVRVGDRRITSIDDVFGPGEIAKDGTLLHAGKKHMRRLVLA